MRGPGGSSKHLLTNYYFPTGASDTTDGGEQVAGLLGDMGATHSVSNTKLTKK